MQSVGLLGQLIATKRIVVLRSGAHCEVHFDLFVVRLNTAIDHVCVVEVVQLPLDRVLEQVQAVAQCVGDKDGDLEGRGVVRDQFGMMRGRDMR